MIVATFYAGVVVELLFSLSIALIVRGVARYRVDRSWTVAEQGELETAHSAL